MPATIDTTTPKPKMIPVAVRVLQCWTSLLSISATSEYLGIRRQYFAQSQCDLIGLAARLQFDQPEIDHAERALGKHALEIRIARNHDAKPDKTSSELILPPDLEGVLADLDQPSPGLRSKHRQRRLIDQHCIGPPDDIELTFDLIHPEDFVCWPKPHHEHVAPQATLRVQPRCCGLIKRHCQFHFRQRHRLVEALAGKIIGPALKVVGTGSQQEIKPQTVVNPHPPFGTEK